MKDLSILTIEELEKYNLIIKHGGEEFADKYLEILNEKREWYYYQRNPLNSLLTFKVYVLQNRKIDYEQIKKELVNAFNSKNMEEVKNILEKVFIEKISGTAFRVLLEKIKAKKIDMDSLIDIHRQEKNIMKPLLRIISC